MKRKLLSIAIMVLPMTMIAQNTWELPESRKPKTVVDISKEKKTERKKDKNGVTKINADGKTYTVKTEDLPYLKGAVPEEDGKVVFTQEYDTHGMSAAKAYDVIYSKLEQMLEEEIQTPKSKIAIVNKEQHSIVAQFSEWMVFQDKILVLDRAQFGYLLVAECNDGKATVSISRLGYEYEAGREKSYFRAEDIITDKDMLSNNGYKLRKVNSKYRKATVDRVKQIFAGIGNALAQQ